VPSPEVLGPLAAFVFVVMGSVIYALWREHLKSDVDDRAQRDQALAGWRDQTAATNRLAAALEARNRRDAKQGRADDQ
jgi:hypothetical protein